MALIDNIYSTSFGVLYCFMFDSSGSSMNLINGTGTYNNVTYSVPSLLAGSDPVDTGIGFNGTTAYCDITAIIDYALPDNFTIFATFRPSSATGSRSVFENDKYGIWIDAGVIKFRYVTSGPTNHDLSSGVTVSVGRRYAVFVVHTGTAIKIYVDSVLKATVTVGSLVTPSGNPQLGRRLGGTAFYAGDIGRSGLLGQALDETTLVYYSDSIIAISQEVTESVDVDFWSEVDYAGQASNADANDNLFIDWDWFESVYAGLPQSNTAFDNLNLTETISRHGTFRDQANDNIVITQVVNHINPYYQSLHQTITLTEAQTRFGTARPKINEQINIDELVTVQGQLEYAVQQFLFFNEKVTLQGLPTNLSVSESFTLIQSTSIEWGIANITITDALNFVERVGLRLSIWSPIITEHITLTEKVSRLFVFSLSDALTFTQAAQKVVINNLTDALAFIETMVIQKVRPTKDFLTFFEDVCTHNIFNRTVTDQLTLSDRALVFGRDLTTGVNNPLFVGWTDLTETQWNNLTEDQWNNLLTTSPTDNTGTIVIPIKRAIKLKQRIDLIETLHRVGGRAHCDSTLQITTVLRLDATHYIIIFNTPVTTINPGTPDSNFTVDGNPPVAVIVQSGSAITIQFASTATGLTYNINDQPNWLVPSIKIPETGVTT